MNFDKIIREGARLVKDNYVLALPTVLMTFLTAFISISVIHAQEDMAQMALMGLLSIVLSVFAHGITLAMALEAIQKGKTSVKTALVVTSAFFLHFMLAALVMAIIVSVGLALLVVPGLLAIYFLMFTFPAIVVHGLGPLDALVASFRLVMSNFKSTLQFFLLLMAISFVITILNMILSQIPVLGQLVGVVLSGFMGGFFSVMVLRAYLVLKRGVYIGVGEDVPQTTPEHPVQ